MMRRQMEDTQRSQTISTNLQQIAQQAIDNPTQVFTSLAHKLDVNLLQEAYRRVRKDGATGYSGRTAKDYRKHLQSNLEDLYQRLKEKRYIAPPIKRIWIEKANGKKRPIGLLEFEDKIVQKAVSMLLGAVYEQDFYPFSHGFREQHSAHDAIKDIREGIIKQNASWIIDADISGFFDNINHHQLRELIKQRVNDGGLIRLIGKWLNAGIIEGDAISYSDEGTPQGGVISPVLANIYLHYVLDEWFIKEVQPRLKGKSFIVRYADDFIIGCEDEDDARRIKEVLIKRFNRYGLTIHPEKTQLLSFKKPDKMAKRGDNTFDFLGFTHYWARSRTGTWIIKRKTASQKITKTIQSLREWCRQNRHIPLERQYRILSSKLRGHFQYFGIRCNMRAMEVILYQAIRGWRYWLSRRCHKGYINWEQFKKLLEKIPLPKPRIIHNV